MCKFGADTDGVEGKREARRVGKGRERKRGHVLTA
jgi:hypothetical protein